MPPERIGMGAAVPVLRMFDAADTTDFYCDYLGFTVVWTHRFAPDLPLYRRLRRDDCVIDLSQHHGDSSPAVSVWIPVADLAAFHHRLVAARHPRSRPGIDANAPGGPTMTVIDPAANQLRFCQIAET